MVDFKKHVSKKQIIDFTNLGSLFDSIDRQTSHIELRTVQRDALRILSEQRRQQDLILKINTGVGKTAVGLLYLWSFMEEKHRPVVYLCSTKQLCEQVNVEAEKLGLKSVIYPAGQLVHGGFPDLSFSTRSLGSSSNPVQTTIVRGRPDNVVIFCSSK